MSPYHSGTKETLSFYELERRNAFDQNRHCLFGLRPWRDTAADCGLPAKESKMYNRITSQGLASTEYYGKQRNWQT